MSHAVNTVWENPSRDNHVIIRTNLINRRGGSLGVVNIPWGSIQLPSNSLTGGTFELYELGGFQMRQIGLDIDLYGWVNLKTVMQRTNTLILPFQNGRILDLEFSYLKQHTDGTILLAANFQKNAKVLTNHDYLYVKLYKNINFVEGLKGDLDVECYQHTSITGTKLSDLLLKIQNFETTHETKPLVFVNGLFRPDGFDTSTMKVADRASVIFDPYLRFHESFDPGDSEDSNTYSSSDGIAKTIFSMSEDSNAFIDDCEFMLSGVDLEGNRIGIMSPRLKLSDIMMLTYVDYSVATNTLTERMDAVLKARDLPDSLTDIKYHILYRKNDRPTPVILDSSRISDLMNLKHEDRLEAMVGSNAMIENWRASNLEHSKFSKWISGGINYLTKDNLKGVLSAYSIYSIMEYIQPNPGETNWLLPNTAKTGGRLIEFTEDGSSIGNLESQYTFGDHRGSTYIGKGVELFMSDEYNTGPVNIPMPFGSLDPIQTPPDLGVFCFYDDQSILKPAALDVHYTRTSTGLINWKPEMRDFNTWVRHAGRRTQWRRVITEEELHKGFDLYDGEGDGLDVPYGDIYIWRNNRFLIPTLDYVINGTTILLSSGFVDEAEDIVIEVLGCGLPSIDFEHNEPIDIGWVAQGEVSANNKYDLYMNRGNWLFADGRACLLGLTNVDEEFQHLLHEGTDLSDRNGRPFVLMQKPRLHDSVIVTEYSDTITNEKALDKVLETYLNSIVETSEKPVVTVLGEDRYNLVSLVMANIIRDIDLGVLNVPDTELTDFNMHMIMSPYIHLLEWDVCLHEDLEPAYVEVHLTFRDYPLTLKRKEYALLQAVNERYLNNLVIGFNQIAIT